MFRPFLTPTYFFGSEPILSCTVSVLSFPGPGTLGKDKFKAKKHMFLPLLISIRPVLSDNLYDVLVQNPTQPQ